ncbi:hypothetical protein V202x_27580 [Gimesia aquarii]|uniref:Uncharacterized protein n=1 Tax=Gimesia aquarii TaxID=2527964 RepID=A0A517WVU2_9PLAN|nr:hypothetical protein V202x_27580 [Gimesia aquarii]
MFEFPVIERGTVLLRWSYHAKWHTAVKKNLCALMSQVWYEIAVWFPLWLEKACSKGVIPYETAGTGYRLSGEKLEKMGHFRMHKPKLCVVCSYQKKPPRARETETGSFENGAWVSSAKISTENQKQVQYEASRNGHWDSFFRRMVTLAAWAVRPSFSASRQMPGASWANPF